MSSPKRSGRGGWCVAMQLDHMALHRARATAPERFAHVKEAQASLVTVRAEHGEMQCEVAYELFVVVCQPRPVLVKEKWTRAVPYPILVTTGNNEVVRTKMEEWREAHPEVKLSVQRIYTTTTLDPKGDVYLVQQELGAWLTFAESWWDKAPGESEEEQVTDFLGFEWTQSALDTWLSRVLGLAWYSTPLRITHMRLEHIYEAGQPTSTTTVEFREPSSTVCTLYHDVQLPIVPTPEHAALVAKAAQGLVFDARGHPIGFA